MTDTLLEAMARAIAKENGDDLDAIPRTKAEWIDARGQFGGRFRDVNEPRRDDYTDMVRAALTKAREMGWQLVPIEPTAQQQADLADAIYDDLGTADCYRAALSRAPKVE